MIDALVLFFKPLLALLMLLRLCEIFDFGTAIRIGGKSSSREDKDGRVRYHGAVEGGATATED